MERVFVFSGTFGVIKTVLPSLRTLCPQADVNLQKIMPREFETHASIPEKTSVIQLNRPSPFEISQLFRVVLHKKNIRCFLRGTKMCGQGILRISQPVGRTFCRTDGGCLLTKNSSSPPQN